jgi:hypothetical protein
MVCAAHYVLLDAIDADCMPRAKIIDLPLLLLVASPQSWPKMKHSIITTHGCHPLSSSMAHDSALSTRCSYLGVVIDVIDADCVPHVKTVNLTSILRLFLSPNPIKGGAGYPLHH